MLHNTGRKGASSAKFAIREPQPAGLSLRAGLQQLRGAAGSSQMQGGGGCPTEDAILIEAENEQASMATPAPSLSRAALPTHTPAQGISQSISCSHWAVFCKFCSLTPSLQGVGFAPTLLFPKRGLIALALLQERNRTTRSRAAACQHSGISSPVC